MDTGMKIVELRIENVKKIKAALIEPAGDVVTIEGKNGAGKSTVLDSIAYALGGSGALPDRPIRDGAESAKIVCDLGKIRIVRKITPKGTYLDAFGEDGTKLASPQAAIDAIVGTPAVYEIMEFLRAKPSDQRDTLLALTGLADQLARIDAERAEAYDNRRLVNREQQTAASRAAVLGKRTPTAERVDVRSAEAARTAAKGMLSDANEKRALARGTTTEMESLMVSIERTTQDIFHLETRLAAMRAEVEEKRTKATTMYDAATKILTEAEDIEREYKPVAEETAAKIAEASARNAACDRNDAIDKAEAEASRLATESERMSAAIVSCDERRAEMLRNAAFPVDGLGFDSAGVTFNGIPLKQASSAEQIRCSLAIGAAMNPQLRVLLVRDGSLLDDDSLRAVKQMAVERDCQVWIETINSSEPGTVRIVDGEISE